MAVSASPAGLVDIANSDPARQPMPAATLTFLDKLRRLPTAWPRPAMLWVPRPCRQQVGALLRTAVGHAVDCATAAEGDLAAEQNHLFARALPQLLLRPPAAMTFAQVQEAEAVPCANGMAGRAVRARLDMIKAGQWHELIDECLADLADEIAHPQPQRRYEAATTMVPDGALTASAAQAATVRARTGALRSAASLLAGAPPVPPGPGTDEKLKELLPHQPLGRDAGSRLTKALEAAMAVPRRRRLRVTPRMVGKQVARLRAAAGPGPSGWRNTHIQCMHATPEGPATLAAWTAVWAQGDISPWLAALWTPSLARPFWKNDSQEGVRPILCGEPLLKFAMAVCVHAVQPGIAAAVGPRQFGAGASAGAEREIAEVRAAAEAFLGLAMLSLDMKNAFGSVAWSDVLEAVVAAVPELAPAIAAQWATRMTRVYSRNETGTGWHYFNATGGLSQGVTEAQPAFCLVLAVVISRVMQDPALPEGIRAQMRTWAYVDDWLLQVPVTALGQVWDAVVRHAATFNLQVQPVKSVVHLPCCAGRPVEEHPDEVRAFAGKVQVQPEGFTLLGTEAAGELAIPLKATRVVEATLKRQAKAELLGRRLLELIDLAPLGGARQVAWHLARSILAHALSYDARILPSRLVRPSAAVVELCVCAVVDRVLGDPVASLSNTAKEQLSLPVRNAGLQMDMPLVHLPLARASALMEVGPVVRQAVASWPGCTAEDATRLDGVDEALRDGLWNDLAAIGINSLGGDGRPTQAIRDAEPEQQLRPPVPARHLLSAMIRIRADVALQRMLEAAPPDICRRLRSAGGPTAGQSFIAPLGTPGIAFTDQEWHVSLRWRLGAVPVRVQAGAAPVQFCANWNQAKGKVCGEQLDGEGNHAVCCPCGPLTNLCHNAIADRYGDICAEAGAVVRREAFIPELTTPEQEAWMDILLLGHSELGGILGDVTVRHPNAQRGPAYLHAAATTPGATAAHAEAEKANRYPPVGDVVVRGLAHETWGRLGALAEDLLATAAAAATRDDHRRGRVPLHRLRRWRAQLDADLQRAVAAQHLSAVCGIPGRPHGRTLPVDLPCLQARGAWPQPRVAPAAQ